MKKLFRPGFLNPESRAGSSCSGHSPPAEITQIVELMVADLPDRMIAQNMTINLSEEARLLIAKGGDRHRFRRASFAPRYPAPARRPPVRADSSKSRWTSGSVVDVDVEDGAGVQGGGDRLHPRAAQAHSIAREAELLLTNFDLAMRAVRAPACGLAYRRCVGLNGRVMLARPVVSSTAGRVFSRILESVFAIRGLP